MSIETMRQKLAADPTHGAPVTEAARIGEISRASSVLLFAIAFTVVALLAWASVAELDTVAQSMGRVVPSARVQVVQSLEGGVVTAIHVEAGQTVDAGTPLVSLSPTQASGDLQSRNQQTRSLAARAARLQAEAEGRSPAFPPELSRGAPEAVQAELAAYESRRAEQSSQSSMLSSQIAQRTKELEEARILADTARRTLAGAREERAMIDRLVKQGLEPQLELVRIERAITDAEGREQGARASMDRLREAIVEARQRLDAQQRNFRAQARDELTKTLAELRASEPALPVLQERRDRTELRAPVKGVVNRVLLTTVGGVAKPGEPLIEMVPADDTLVVEALVSPKDIGFIAVGQNARVKLTAFDASIYGSLPGKVVRVGADSIANEKGEAFYQVRVETDRALVDSQGRRLQVMAGMQAQVDIVTGAKTVLTYLMKPLVGVRDSAFRER